MLGELVSKELQDGEVVVLALPRGGVPVGFEVARALRAPLDVFLVRKLGVPGQEELALGAIASGGVRVLNRALVKELRLPSQNIDEITEHEVRELERREHLYRQGFPALDVAGRTVVLVDDGLATGASLKAAAEAVRTRHPKEIIVAVPVAPGELESAKLLHADRVICPFTPEPFIAVGIWYENFAQTTDNEVKSLLKQAREAVTARKP
ncbi:MAG: hypothetical protein JO061_11225 [Acidobacteriaceae bacterium]|nr:hypothetical protein [Acidobacteriaceae bacterium]